MATSLSKNYLRRFEQKLARWKPARDIQIVRKTLLAEVDAGYIRVRVRMKNGDLLELMAKTKTLPKFSSYEEAGEWLDTHSTADLETSPAYFELAPNFTVRLIDSLDEGETLITVEQTLSKQISQLAQKQGITIEVLVNRWLQEKVLENAGMISQGA